MSELKSLSTRQLLVTYAEILDELLRRGIIRSRNAPAGDLAEHLTQLVYGGELAPAAEKSWDVRALDGRLLQVKCRVVGEGRRSQSFSPFRSWDFDSCVFVVLNSATYDVVSAREVQAEDVRAVASRSEWVRGDRVTVSAVAQMPGRNVTDAVREALSRL